MRLAARLGHRPGLDGVRGAAILAVLALHTLELAGGPDWFGGGWIGVDVFFVLSGFLITGIVASTCSETGWVGRFYARRVRRLAPASLVLLAVVALTGATTGIVACLAYVQNYVIASGQVFPQALRHTWSLAIEEQFYLVWPCLLALVVRWPRRVAVLLAMGAVGVVAWRWHVYSYDPYGAYRRTDTKIDGLMAGSALALAGPAMWTALGRLRRVGWVLFAVLVLSIELLPGWVAAGPAGIVVDVVAVLLVAGGTLAGGIGEHPVLRWLGRYSYSLYLWHFPFLVWWGSWWAVPAYLTAAVASWHFVERRFLRHRPSVLPRDVVL